jgi:uncharacterized repeat protein (TIGR01451 family)
MKTFLRNLQGYQKAVFLVVFCLLTVTSFAQISGRVFKDANNDGIRNGTDAGIGNLTIEIYKGGIKVGQTITSTATATLGQYSFASADVTGGITTNTFYELKIATTQTPLANLELTLSNMGSDDTIDNDAAMPNTGTTPVLPVYVRTPATSANNDFGFKAIDPDLEITKTISTPSTKTVNGSAIPTAKAGEVVTMVVKLANKGQGVASGVEVTTEMPMGVFSSTTATPSVGSYASNKWSIPSAIAPNSTVSLTITATVAATFQGGVIQCKSYISKETEHDLNTVLGTDVAQIDSVAIAGFSTPIKMCVGESVSITAGIPSGSTIQWYKDGAVLGTATASPTLNITATGNYTFSYTVPASGIAAGCPSQSCYPICIEGCIDLALDKKLAVGQASSVYVGQDVKFTLKVYNQGNMDVKDIQITDYLPADMLFDGSKTGNAGWVNTGGKIAKTLTGTLAAGNSITTDIVLTVKPTFAGGSIRNDAEISKIYDLTGTARTDDVDSTPDNDPANDGTAKDDVITENHKKTSTDDEDDADYAVVTTLIYGSIGDYVWKDANSNGLQDTGELGVKNVTVELWSSDATGTPIAKLKTKITDANGLYLFDSLAAGNYVVKFITTNLPADCNKLTTQTTGTDRAKDSDPNPTTGVTGVIVLNPSDPAKKDIRTIDAGVVPLLGSLGDYVWKDINSNGLQDATEVGVKDVIVELYTANALGNPGTLLKTKVTDVNGKYLFDSLVKGDYIVKFVTTNLPADCNKITKQTVGTDKTKDSDPNPTTGFTGVITIDPTVAATKDIRTVDAGIVPLYGSLGDYVWKDFNGNGLQDATEKGIKDVVVELYKSDASGAIVGAILQTTKTDVNGKYLFDSLIKGDYVVKFVTTGLPADCNKITTQTAGTDRTKDSDANPNTGLSGKVSIDPTDPAKKDIMTIDAGIVPLLGSLGDYVWKDFNGNGIQDATEKGVKGVTVELWSSDTQGVPVTKLKTTLTDVNGKYLFDSLAKGDYVVKFLTTGLPADCNKLTTQTAGTDSAKDSNPNPTTGITAKISIDPTDPIKKNILTIDAGIVPLLGSIGDYVWKDFNSNGLQDAGEIGVKNVIVELWSSDANGTPLTKLKTTTTDINGKYLFDSLAKGDYVVKFITTSLPADCKQLTTPLAGSDTSKDSDANPSTGLSGKIALDPTDPAKKNILTIDAGIIPVLGSIGDYVWKDFNSNGLQDVGELGVKNVTVELWSSDANGNPVTKLKSTKTDINGKYLFDSLVKGDYVVKFITSDLPADCNKLTTPAVGTDPAKDSNPNPTTGVTPKISLDPTDPTKKSILTIDAGLVPLLGSIGDYVWKDFNGNGIQDATEAGVKNVTVELWSSDANGAAVTKLKSTKTDISGKYLFDSLVKGDYVVKFITSDLPADCNKLTTPSVGTDPSKDSNPNPTTGITPKISIDPTDPTKKSILTIDAGLVPVLGSIGDYVWKDFNSNGIQESTEKGVANVSIELWSSDANGTPQTKLKTTKTDVNGKYLFDSLLKGDYVVKFLTTGLPTDCNQLTNPLKGTDTAKDSDPNPTNGLTGKISLDPTDPAKKNILTIDAGLVPLLGSIGDYVWKDLNGNGLQDAGEPGVKNVTVELWSSDAVGALVTKLKSVKTDINGKYLFDSLVKGNYVVKFITSDLPADCNKLTTPNGGTDKGKDSDPNPSTGVTPVISIDPTDPTKKNILTVDAGLIPIYGSIGDYVWKDANDNGIQDLGESGVKNVTVELYRTDANGTPQTKLKTTKTDANGKYLFDSLSSGDYKVKFVATSYPADCILSKQNQGTDDTKDSDVETGGFSPKVTINTLGTGIQKDNLTIDAGLITNPDLLGCPLNILDKAPKICNSETTAKLQAANQNQTWSFYSGPSAASIDTKSGLATGLIKRGIYRFILTGTSGIATCRDTVLVKKGILLVPDVTICGTENTAKLEAAGNGNTWAALAGNPTNATIDQNGNVTGVLAYGTYSFLIQNTTCKDTARVIKRALIAFQVEAISVTCNVATPNNDGKLVLNGYPAGAKADYSEGTTYTGSKTYSTASAIPAGGVIVNNLSNPSGNAGTTYTVRVWDSNGCYTDRQVTINKTDCSCPPPKCVPFNITVSKK